MQSGFFLFFFLWSSPSSTTPPLSPYSGALPLALPSCTTPLHPSAARAPSRTTAWQNCVELLCIWDHTECTGSMFLLNLRFHEKNAFHDRFHWYRLEIVDGDMQVLSHLNIVDLKYNMISNDLVYIDEGNNIILLAHNWLIYRWIKIK
jgi:hypothetical protein